MPIDKVCYILRGIPGCGKSSHAKFIQFVAENYGLKNSVRSTDDQFMVNNVYMFNPQNLGAAHEQNRRLVESDMINKVNFIVIDNTNILIEHMKPYMELANKYGYEVVVIDHWMKQIMEDFEKFPKETAAFYAERNTHGVPQYAIDRMIRQWEPYNE